MLNIPRLMTMSYSVTIEENMNDNISLSMHDNLQQELLDALLEAKLQDFKRLLHHPAVNPSHKYGKPHFGSCLEIACRRRAHPEFVKEILTKVKPNINHIVPEPIHHAAGRGNPESLELLLKDKRTRVNAQDSSGRTALHYVAKNFPEGEESAFFEQCLLLLLQHPDVNINSPNDKGFTPIHEAVHSPAGRAAVVAFLKNANGKLDLDSFRGHGRTARETILLRFPDLGPILPKPHSNPVSNITHDQSLNS